MIPYLGMIVLRLFVTRLLIVSAFYVASLGFSLGLFSSTLDHTLDLPLFDNCDNVSSVCTKEGSHRLETLLNFACRTVLHKCRDYSASSDRKKLGISTLFARRKSHLAQIIYKCVSLQSPTYLSNLFPLQLLTIILEHASSTSQLNL